MPTRERQINPGKAGPKGALDLPAAKANRGLNRDNHSQHPWAEKSSGKAARKRRSRH